MADIETTKDSQGRYIYINVVEGGQNRIWKLPKTYHLAQHQERR